MTEQAKKQDDLADLSPEDRAIVLRGRALLQSLKGKPKVSKGLQARSDSASMDIEELRAKAEEEQREKQG